jgi:hypothetical protein
MGVWGKKVQHPAGKAGAQATAEAMRPVYCTLLPPFKAHQERPSDDKPHELREWRGNDRADILAKEGSRLSTVHHVVPVATSTTGASTTTIELP